MTSKRKNPCTNWFPGSVKPVRVGVYKRIWKNFDGTQERVFTFWNGNFWGHSHTKNISLVLETKNRKGIRQNLAWCGLANDPEKNK